MPRNAYLHDAIDRARRAQLAAAGGLHVVEADERDRNHQADGKTRVQRARYLQQQGLSYRQIGGLMGVSHAVVCKWLSDTYAEKQRQWFRDNADRHKARARARYWANRDLVLEQKRRRYVARKATA